MSDQNRATAAPPCFRFKSSQILLTELELLDHAADRLSQHLRDQAQAMPQLFKQMPIVLCLDKLPEDQPLPELAELVALCREVGINPIGARGDQRLAADACHAVDLAHFSSTRGTAREETAAAPAEQPATVAQESTAPPAATPAATAPPQAAKIITTPVRSGQQVYARGGDLIILSSVSAGAEVMADGNIHVYGPLRGRAMAGVSGQQQARIFCQSLEAELISIAGYFKACDDLQSALWKQPAQAYLTGTRLDTAAL